MTQLLKRRRSILLGLAGTGVAATGSLLARTTQPQTVAVVGDYKHYFEVEHPRVLSALMATGFDFSTCAIKAFQIEYAKRETLDAACEQLARLRPNLILVVGDPEAQAVRAAIPDIPIIFVVNHDCSELGLTHSISVPNALATGNCGDQLQHVEPLRILRGLLGDSERRAVAIATSDAWYSPARMKFWDAAAAALNLELQHVRVHNIVELRQDQRWRSAGDFDGWVLPLTQASVLWKQEMVDHLNRSGTISMFERFTATRIGAPFAYTADSLFWYDYIALAIKLGIGGVPLSEIPIRTAFSWRYGVNTAAAASIGVTIPETLMTRFDEVF